MKQLTSLALLWAVSAIAQVAPGPVGSKEVDDAAALLSKITGLRVLKKVQFDSISKPQFKKYLDDTIKEHMQPEELRLQELALKKFGLVPQDFDLMNSTVALLTEQAAAFYDYRQKKLFLMEEGDGEAQPVLVLHELAHAVADQHFDLGKFMKRGDDSDDAALARLAVLEGQATWLMLESVAQKTGVSLKTMPAMVDAMSGAGEQMASQYPVLSKAPLYIRASLLFPYKEGFRFQHAIVQKLGQAAFTKVFKEAPISTQQILHPEAYLSGQRPTSPVLPEIANADGYKELIRSAVGEFDHAVLIEQYVSAAEAAALSPKWRGGTLGLLEHKIDKRVILQYASDWQDEGSASQMFRSYKEVLKKKLKISRVDTDSEKAFGGTAESGAFYVSLSGNRVSALEGLSSVAEVKTFASGHFPKLAVAAH